MFKLAIGVKQPFQLAFIDTEYEILQENISPQEESKVSKKKEAYEVTGQVSLIREMSLVFQNPQQQQQSQDLIQNRGKNLSFQQSESCLLPLMRSKLIYFLAIPAEIDFQQFYEREFQDRQVRESVTWLKLVKHSKFDSFYSLLVRVDSQEVADKIFVMFNGRYFSEEHKETIHAIFISSLLYFQQEEEKEKMENKQTDHLHLFLPSCPVCLERLDVSITGLSTNLFFKPEQQKGEQWLDIGKDCAVCSIEQFKTSGSSSGGGSPEKFQKLFCCFNCESKEELWICMICSEINCGRYNKAHAVKHFDQTQHSFCFEINSQRIWHYQGDSYVHRIIKRKEKEENKEVVFEDHATSNRDGTQSRNVDQIQNTTQSDVDERMLLEKIQNTIKEYNILLTTQLDLQKQFFEQQIQSKIEKDLKQNKDLKNLKLNLMLLREEKEKKKMNEEILLQQISEQKKFNEGQEKIASSIQKKIEEVKEEIRWKKENIAQLKEMKQDNKNKQQQSELNRLKKIHEKKQEEIERLESEISEGYKLL